ncbi:MAG: DUF11 domain-containing protein, partial [Planctomycetes bacterium]|nr:DUF11 domain-containing protein [Planctomycetota bacterium]
AQTTAPTVQFTAASQSGAENVGTMTVTAQLSATSGLDVTVPYTLSGTAANPADYTITASPVTISAGNLTAAITITVVDDTLDELDETVIVTMGTPTNATKGATDIHTATISDDDASLTVTTAAVASITTTTADCGGNVTADGGADVTARGVCWSTLANPTTVDDHTTDGAGTGAFTSTITGLSPNITYHVRAYATNSVGTAYGADVQFTTGTTTPTVTTTAASSITDTTAQSGGNVTADGGADVTARGVCWSTFSNPTIDDDRTMDSTGTGEFTSNLTGLNPDTTYYAAAYATNSVGTAYGDDVSFTTNAAPVIATVPTVTTADVFDISTTGATCGGNVTADGGAAVTARGVCRSTFVNPTTADDKTEDGAGTGEFTSNLTGLSPGTTYYAAAYATNSAGTAYGDDVTFTTAALEPEPEAETAPDLRVRIEAPAENAHVGDELTFGVSVENVGDGGAIDVVLIVPLPENTEFVSAWRAASQAAQAAPLNASVIDDEITIEVGDVAPGEEVQMELALRALVAGKVAVCASTTSAETATPSTTQAMAEVDVEDVYWTVVETIIPIHACGVLGIMPVFVLLGLFGLKLRGHTRAKRDLK